MAIVDVRTGTQRLLGEGTKPTWVDDHTLIIEDYRLRDSVSSAISTLTGFTLSVPDQWTPLVNAPAIVTEVEEHVSPVAFGRKK